MASWKVLSLVLLLSACGGSEKKQEVSQKQTSQDDEIVGYGQDEVAEEEIKTPVMNEESLEDQLIDALKDKKYSNVKLISAKLLSRNENNIKALNALGVANFKAKKYGIAKIFWSRVIEKDKENSQALNNLGVLQLIEGKDSEAISFFKKSIRFDSDNTSAKLNLGSIYLKYYNFKAAEAALDMAYSDNKKDAYFLSNFAISLKGIGKSSKAISYLEDAVDMNNKNVDLAMNYASALIHSGKELKTAEKVITQVKLLTQDPKDLVRLSKIQKQLNEVVAKKRRAEARSKK